MISSIYSPTVQAVATSKVKVGSKAKASRSNSDASFKSSKSFYANYSKSIVERLRTRS